MCLMCVEFIKNRMTFKETRKALPELIETAQDPVEKDHYEALAKAVSEEELLKLIESEQSDESKV